MQEKENVKQILRLEDIDERDVSYSDDNELSELQAVEFEMIAPFDITDERQVEIYRGISEIDDRLSVINQRIDELNAEIDRLTNHADKLDYIIAIGSGILTGVIDIVFVGEFSLERGRAWGEEKVNSFVKKAAKFTGYKGDSLDGAIKHLEKYGTPSDSVTSKFGGGKQHHLRDFAHHPTLVGLFFSILTQFTEMAYGTDAIGNFKIEPITNKTFIGKDIPQKLLFGSVFWFLHMVSDMAGTNATAGAGTGLPGPLLSLAKELSSLPIFKNSKLVEELRLKISKLFNGTLLAQHDENGKIIKGTELRFDLRTELGIAHELGRQALPVIINEVIVRGFYFIRRLYWELKEKKSLEAVEWKKTLPFRNRTIVRMMTIATGTFTAVDVIGAAIEAIIRSGGINPATIKEFVLRVNFVGIGRFAVAVFSDVSMGIKRSKLRNERMDIRREQIALLNAKVFYKQADMWIAAENTGQAIQEVYVVMEKSAEEFVRSWSVIITSLDNITSDVITSAEEHNEGLIDELLDIL